MFGFRNKRRQEEHAYLRSREKEAAQIFKNNRIAVKEMHASSKQRLKVLDQEMAEHNRQQSVVSPYFEKGDEPDGD